MKKEAKNELKTNTHTKRKQVKTIIQTPAKASVLT